MAIELLMDESKYAQALSDYDTELGKLKGYRDDLAKRIRRMSGSNYSGSMVQPSIDKAKQALDAVNNAIAKVEQQKASIEFQLTQSQKTGSQLEKDMNNINIPDLFK